MRVSLNTVKDNPATNAHIVLQTQHSAASWTKASGALFSKLLGVCCALTAACQYLPAQEPAYKTIPAAASAMRPPTLLFPNHGLGDDAVVRVVTPFTGCTGTLIAPDMVLTAHHCVATRDDDGQYLDHDVDAKDVQIQLGGDYLPWGEVSVSRVVAPPCGYAAGVGDIAILLLPRAIKGVTPKELDLDTRPRNGLQIDAVGFGRCSDSEEGIRLRERTSAKVDRVRPTRFQVEAAICPGDSGGPGLSVSGSIVGVISASALDGQERTKNRTEFTRVDQWQELFSYAQRLAQGENEAELPPIAGCEID